VIVRRAEKAPRQRLFDKTTGYNENIAHVKRAFETITVRYEPKKK